MIAKAGTELVTNRTNRAGADIAESRATAGCCAVLLPLEGRLPGFGVEQD